MKNGVMCVCSIICNALLSTNVTGAEIRDEVNAWVTLIGSIAITLTTIGIQVYHLIRDRNKEKNKPTDAEKEDKENDEKNG